MVHALDVSQEFGDEMCYPRLLILAAHGHESYASERDI